MKKTLYEKIATRHLPEFVTVTSEMGNSISYDDFIQTSYVLQTTDMDNTSTSALQTFYYFYMFHRFHEKTYQVNRTIADMFVHTKIDIDVELFKPPVPGFLILLPNDFFKIRNIVGQDKELPPTKFMIPDIAEEDKMNLTQCYVTFSEDEKFFYLFFVGSIKDEEGCLYFRIDLNQKTVHESIVRSVEEWDFTQAGNDPEANSFENKKSWIPYLNFVCNSIIYITSPDCDLRLQQNEDVKRLDNLGPKKRKKFERKIQKQSRLHYYTVGGSVQLSSQEEEMYERLRDGIQQGHYSCRFQVGGHWRKQWYGHKVEQEQRPKWIRPFIKGPELAEIMKSIGVIKNAMV